MSRRRSSNGSVSARIVARVMLVLALVTCACSVFRPLARPFIKPFVVNRINPGFEVQQPSVMVFYVDGLRKDVFEEMAAAGELPRLKRFILDRGASVENAVTSIPSITYGNATAMITGVYPSHHGVVANKWFDRDRLVLRNYQTADTMLKTNLDLQVPTVYEILDDKLTAVIGMQMHRGAKLHLVTETGDGGLPAGVAWTLGYQDEVDQLIAENIADLADMVRCLRRWPHFTLVYFPGPDDVAHFKGAASPEYRRSLRSLDRSLGGILCALDNGGVLDRMTLVLTSDHGMHDVQKDNFLDVTTLVRDSTGLPTYRGEHDVDEDQAYLDGVNQSSYLSRARRFRECRAVVTHSGERQAFIHLRTGPDWSVRPTLDEILNVVHASEGQTLPGILVSNPGIAFVAVRDGTDSVQVWGKTGVARIGRQRGTAASAYRYEVLSGEDPLFHEDGGAPPIADGQLHPSREWLEATASLRHPDAVAQLGDLFDNRRTGDLAVFAAPDWDFSEQYLGGHGGLEAEEMHIPMYFAGPHVTPGTRIHAGRLVDLVPTVLDLMGVGERSAWYRFDGASLAPELAAEHAASAPE
jgi:arylsulfatase A-like enzyme